VNTPEPEAKAEAAPKSVGKTKAEPKREVNAPQSSGRIKRRTLIAVLILLTTWAVVVIGFRVARLWENSKRDPNRLILYGNVDLRQVDLAFNNSERLVEVLVQEGDTVKRGQILAKLDRARLKPEVAEAEAEVEAQDAVLQRLHHGSRPQEIAQAQANFASATADFVNVEQQWRRLTALVHLTTGRAASQQDLDAAKAAMGMAQARQEVSEKALDLSATGPREEDIAEGLAQLHAKQARLELLRRELADADLFAPCDAVVRSRLLEPGEMVSPQRPVFNLAIIDPKWIRTYVSEADLGKTHPGMKALISTDGFPGRTIPGWVGFISSVAEFTPKSVQTVELRPSLVYEIRIFVKDPGDALRLGMPATVSLEIAPVPSL
jgi:HlyD family secretion protein